MVSAVTELVEGKISMEQLKARKDALAKEAGKVVKTAAQSAAKRKVKTEPTDAKPEKPTPQKPTERPAKRSRVATAKAKVNKNPVFFEPVAARPAGEIQSQEDKEADGTQETEVVYSQDMLRTMMEEPW